MKSDNRLFNNKLLGGSKASGKLKSFLAITIFAVAIAIFMGVAFAGEAFMISITTPSEDGLHFKESWGNTVWNTGTVETDCFYIVLDAEGNPLDPSINSTFPPGTDYALITWIFSEENGENGEYVFEDGEYIISVECNDTLTGDFTDYAERTFFKDTTPPTSTIQTEDGTWFNNTTPTIYFILTDNLSDEIDYVVYVNDSNVDSGTIGNFTSTHSSLSLVADGDGEYEIIVQGTDEAGNSINSTPITIYVDSEAPDVSIIFPEVMGLYNYSVSELNYTITDDNPELCWYSTDAGATNSTPIAPLNFTSVTSTEGVNTWIVYCNDSAGNIGFDDVTFTIDTILPEVYIQTPDETTFYTTNQKIEFLIVDNLADPINYEIFVNGTIDKSGTAENGTITSETLSISDNGEYLIRIEATDDAGNTNSSEITIYVETLIDCAEIGVSGEFELTNNIELEEHGACITIVSDDVILNCNGYNITGPGEGFETNGLFIEDVNNITIQNCNITGFFVGVFAMNSTVTISENNLFENFLGTGFGGNSNGTIENNLFSDTFVGSYFETESDVNDVYGDNDYSNVPVYFVNLSSTFFETRIALGDESLLRAYGDFSGQEPEIDKVELLKVLEDWNINVPNAEIFLPEGTNITGIGLDNFDIFEIDASEVSIELNGFEEVNGSLQFGIPDFGLEFSQNITVTISGLSDGEINVYRSILESGPWTTDGLNTTICEVSAGSCVFETTKASYFAAGELEEVTLKISSTSGGSVTQPGEGTYERTHSDVVSIEANPSSGYTFSRWTGDTSQVDNVNERKTTITMLGNYEITAEFKSTSTGVTRTPREEPETEWDDADETFETRGTQGSEITFNVKGQGHTFKIIGLGINYADVEIHSEPILFRMYVGETREVDVTGDGINDISVYLEKIQAGFAYFTFEQLEFEPTVVDDEVIDTVYEEIDTVYEEETYPEKPIERETKIGMIAVIAIILVAIGTIFYLKPEIFKKKK